MRREQVIGVVSSWDIRKYESGWPISFLTGGESEGYSLLITDSRIVGADRPAYPDDFWAYLGPGSSASEDARASAQAKAADIVSNSNFEMYRDKIIKILYDGPGLMVGGSLLLLEVGRRVELRIAVLSPWNPGTISAVDTLISSVTMFAPDKLYSEKTGQRIVVNPLGRGP